MTFIKLSQVKLSTIVKQDCYGSATLLNNFLVWITIYCRCKRWVINSRTQSLDCKTTSELHEGYLLCAEHFQSSQFMNAEKRCSLIHSAVPTIFSIPNPPKHLASIRGDPSVRVVIPATKARMTTSNVTLAVVILSSFHQREQL